MKKKLLTIMLSAVLALSLVACGGDDETAAPKAATTEEEATEEEVVEEDVEVVETSTDAGSDEVTDETWASLQDLYASLTEAYNATLEAYNDDSVAQDDNIEEALNTASELMEQIGNTDRSEVKESEAADWINAMLSVNDIFAAVLNNVQVTDSSAQSSVSFNKCYAGITDDENTYAYLGFGNEIAALMFYNVETNESGSFVGAFTTDDDNNAITITDESLGVTMTFVVEEVDGGYALDMGDVGAAVVEEVSEADFLKAMQSISEGSQPQF